MPYDAALEKALQEFKGISPYVVASRSGVDYDGGKFRVPFFDCLFFIHYPEGRIEQAKSVAPLPQWLQLVLLHYLLHAKGIPVADEWIPYRLLPGASLFEARFRQMAIEPLVRAFGNDIESYKKACAAIK